MAPASQLSVFFDGLCPLCSREIDHYRKQSGSERLSFVDITDATFDAEREGLDPRHVHKVMHTRDQNGNLYTGVDAFIAIWDVLPKYNWLAKLARNGVVRPIMDVGYNAFAFVRPYLPRKSRDCEASPYCDIPKKN